MMRRGCSQRDATVRWSGYSREAFDPLSGGPSVHPQRSIPPADYRAALAKEEVSKQT